MHGKTPCVGTMRQVQAGFQLDSCDRKLVLEVARAHGGSVDAPARETFPAEPDGEPGLRQSSDC